eukprot:1677936-Prymnesium_polylepis.1
MRLAARAARAGRAAAVASAERTRQRAARATVTVPTPAAAAAAAARSAVARRAHGAWVRAAHSSGHATAVASTTLRWPPYRSLCCHRCWLHRRRRSLRHRWPRPCHAPRG